MLVLPARFSGAVISERMKLVMALPLLLDAIFLTIVIDVMCKCSEKRSPDQKFAK